MDLNSFQLEGFVLRTKSEGAFRFWMCHKIQENELLQSHMRTNIAESACHAKFWSFRKFSRIVSRWLYNLNWMSLDPQTICKYIPHHLQTLTSILKKSNFHVPKSIFWKLFSIFLKQMKQFCELFASVDAKKSFFQKVKAISKIWPGKFFIWT